MSGMQSSPHKFPEPIPGEQDPYSLQKRLEKLQSFPVYPADGVLSVPGVGLSEDQHLRYRADDLLPEVKWAEEALAQEPDFSDFLKELIGRVTEKLPGDAKKWEEEFWQKGRDYEATIEDVAVASAANCFVRSVAFVGVLQQLGIEAEAISGNWIGTSRERVRGRYPVGQVVEYRENYSTGGLARHLKGEEGEHHVFTVARHEGRFFFADPALWVKNEDSSPSFPLAREITQEELGEGAVKFPLPNGENRHYTFLRSLVEPDVRLSQLVLNKNKEYSSS